MSLWISRTIRASAKQKSKRSERRPGSVDPWGWYLAGLQSIGTVRELTVPSAGSAIQWINRAKLTYSYIHHKVITIAERVLPTLNANLTSQKRLKANQTSMTEWNN